MNPLNADESAAVAAAIFELAERGDHALATRLAELAERDPDRIRSALSESGQPSFRDELL